MVSEGSSLSNMNLGSVKSRPSTVHHRMRFSVFWVSRSSLTMFWKSFRSILGDLRAQSFSFELSGRIPSALVFLCGKGCKILLCFLERESKRPVTRRRWFWIFLFIVARTFSLAKGFQVSPHPRKSDEMHLSQNHPV